MAQQIVSKQRCPRCGKNTIITDMEIAELICGRCGYVISERLEDSGPEWRSFMDDKTNKARTGASTSLTIHDHGLATIINPINRDSVGKPLPYSMKKTFKRLRVWDSRSQVQNYVDKNLRHAFIELGKMKDKLALSDAVIEKAAYIYRKALDKKLVRGRSITALIAASVYAACRNTETPRTLNDITAAINIKRKDLALCYRMLIKELDLKIPVVDSVQCIARIASKAGLSEKTKRYAVKILKKAKQNRISAGKDPMGMAASALYISTLRMGMNISQKVIAQAAGVTEVTLRNRCKGLKLLDT
ncbi:MAG: transcription initiation factor IIB [Thaumarchaeota archaeon]|nr:transcription initiation factor IIB [Nitrososphaerota archaeon]